MSSSFSAWHKIVMPCPLCLPNQNYKSEEWTHGGSCGGRLWIDEKAVVHCDRCGKSAKIDRMKFSCDCGRHIQNRTYRKYIGGALAIGKIGCQDGNLRWFNNLITNLQNG